jgi:hypothetical protein
MFELLLGMVGGRNDPPARGDTISYSPMRGLTMAAEKRPSRSRLRSNLCWQLTAEHRSENDAGSSLCRPIQ